MSANPHEDQPIETAGVSTEDADAAVVMLHGRGASAGSVLRLSREFDAEGVAYLAPQAARNTWYPNSFMAEIESNEPWLSSALDRVAGLVEDLDAEGIDPERVLLLGFSQGACLASEFVARNPRRYGGLAAFSGGLIGPEGIEFDYGGDLAGTPAFLGCSDVDPHIPEERVHETADALEALGADVTERIYEGMGHTINQDEIASVSEMVADLVACPSEPSRE